VKRLLSSDHLSVDGTLIEAWASTKSFKRGAAEGGDPPPPTSAKSRTSCCRHLGTPAGQTLLHVINLADEGA
jgi:hypothetical protein